jgi:hypothetical protein
VTTILAGASPSAAPIVAAWTLVIPNVAAAARSIKDLNIVVSRLSVLFAYPA